MRAKTDAIESDRDAIGAGTGAAWTFLSNHAHVLLCLAKDPAMRLRTVAERVGITERAVQRIVTDLEQGGYVTKVRQGRCNRYELHPELHLRHPVEAHRTVADLIALVEPTGEERAAGSGKRRGDS